MPRYWVAGRAILCAALLAAVGPERGGAQSLSVALGRAVAKQFNGQRVLIVSKPACLVHGNYCGDESEAGKGLDLDELAREIPSAIRITSSEDGDASKETRSAECQESLRCMVVGFRRQPAGSDSTVVRYLIASYATVGSRRGALYVADYMVELRRTGENWAVVSVKLDRIS